MATLFVKEQQYLPIIQAAAQKYGVPISLIMGHIKQESAYNPTAYRAEPQINDASYGMMQLLLKTAQGMDPSATPEKLMDAAYNIDLGTRLIASNLKRFGNVSDAIAAYNAGTPRKNEKGEYVNSKGVPNVDFYVKQVTKYKEQYLNWLQEGQKTVSFDWWDAIIPIAIIGVIVYYFMNREEEEENEDAEGDNA